MKRELRGKRILVTGASSGIGRALAEEAARAGMRVVLAARSAEKVREIAGELTAAGGQAVAVPADVTLPADRERLLAAVVERLGGLDVLVNNAGIGTQGLFTDSTEERLRQVMEVNFFAPAELIRLAIPILCQGQQPAVVNVASMTARRPMPNWSEYSASKAALAGLSEALRAEFVRFGIDLLLACPGMTNTRLVENLLHNNGKMVINFHKGMPPARVAGKILRALGRNRREIVPGLEAWWLVFASRLFPGIVGCCLSRAVRRQYRETQAPDQLQGGS